MAMSFDFSPQSIAQHLHDIAAFLKLHRCLWSAHVVEFFQDRLWEDINTKWWEDLQCASIQDLLSLPSGKVQDNWCSSLKEFIRTAQNLALFRLPSKDLEMTLPGLSKPTISNVLKQGMNYKKLHEVEILSAVINSVAQAVQATSIVDVGAGQGYLSQVLAFEYGLPVVALDASEHHCSITNERSVRIKKHFVASARKSKQEGCAHVSGPQTATFRVVPGSTRMELWHFLADLFSGTEDSCIKTRVGRDSQGKPKLEDATELYRKEVAPSVVLAGLHACGDLSATMLQTYLMCKEVKAVVSVGCCYNLLSENDHDECASGHRIGFPMSECVKRLALPLGRRARDLACQSAERWQGVGSASAIYNFQQHSLRAGFQLVLRKYYPDLAMLNPTIGRLGKARRRKQVRKHGKAENINNDENTEDLSSEIDKRLRLNGGGTREDFVEFCRAAFERLSVESVAENAVDEIWKEIEPKTGLVGPYWSLRAVLGPVLETYILLDRLLYLQEQLPSQEADMESLRGLSGPRLIPLFDPDVSPRNMAILAIKR